MHTVNSTLSINSISHNLHRAAFLFWVDMLLVLLAFGSKEAANGAVPHCASMTDVPMHRTQRWTPDDTRFPPLTPQHHRAKLLGPTST